MDINYCEKRCYSCRHKHCKTLSIDHPGGFKRIYIKRLKYDLSSNESLSQELLSIAKFSVWFLLSCVSGLWPKFNPFRILLYRKICRLFCYHDCGYRQI